MGQWLYDRRDPVSWCFALGMALPLLWLGMQGVQSAPQVVQDMVARLEIEAPPAPAPPVATPRPVQPQPQLQSQHAPTPAPQLPPVPHAIERPSADAASVAPAPAAPAPVLAQAVAPAAPAAEAPRPQASRAATYESQLLAYLERIKRYPTSREARLSKPQGTVRLWLLLSRQGALLDAGIVASSGANLLDSEALRTVRAGQFPAFPEEAFAGEDRHRFTVNLKYQIEG